MEQEKHSSLYIAPLNIHKGEIRLPTGHPDTLILSAEEVANADGAAGYREPCHGLVSEIIQEEEEFTPEPSPTFHTYLRAFYDFHPADNADSSSITLSLNKDDTVLIHTVHTNGWADGTLLATGARGWLPTNYCESYDNGIIRPLLSALTKFWDLARGTDSIRDLFATQDHVRGLVGGARCVLVRSTIVRLGRRLLIREYRRGQIV